MPAPFRATLLTLLLALVTGVTAAPAAATPLPVRALVDSVAARYAAMDRYVVEGRTHTTMAGGQLPEPMVLDVGFLDAARDSTHVRVANAGPGMSSTTVADGDSIRSWAPELGQFLARALAGAGALGAAQLAALRPLRALAGLAEGVTTFADAGADTVGCTGGAVTCRRVHLTYPHDSAAGAAQVQPRMVWIDEARRLVLRDSVTIDFTSQQAGAMRRTQDTRFVRLVPGDGGPDSLYRLAMPSGARRVREFGASTPARPDLVGKAAHDFTLPALAGGPAVSLSALKGKVVVLDFWATWCGPCRRWMPIVSRVERRLAGRDVRFYAIDLAESPERVREFLRGAPTSLPVLLDRDGKVADLYGAASIPLTVVIDRTGKIAQVLLGLHTEDDLLEALRSGGLDGI